LLGNPNREIPGQIGNFPTKYQIRNSWKMERPPSLLTLSPTKLSPTPVEGPF
jgi:hypothetical protein